MQQFRNLPIFVNAAAPNNSNGLPRPQQVMPRWGVLTPARAQPIWRRGRAPGAGYENTVLDLLDEITKRSVGRLVLSMLPTRFPVLIRQTTAQEARRMGSCNAEASLASDLSFQGQMIRGRVDVSFTPDASFSCVGTGPGAEPHALLFHELTHAYEHSAHARIRGVKITGEMGKYFDNTAEFLSILVTNMYLSENTPELRFHHHGYARLPSEYSSSKTYLKIKGITKVFDLLVKYDRRLTNMLALLPEPKFNPLKEYLSGDYDLTVDDFLPGGSEVHN
jgi:hypothetical protein